MTETDPLVPKSNTDTGNNVNIEINRPPTEPSTCDKIIDSL